MIAGQPSQITTWRTSSRSRGGDNCVEVAFREGAVDLRDSKDRIGPILEIPPAGWAAFIGAVRHGEFAA
jgi:hypothetical protein